MILFGHDCRVKAIAQCVNGWTAGKRIIACGLEVDGYLPSPCAVFKMLNDGCVSPLPTAAFLVISMSVELRIFQEEFCVTQVTARPHFIRNLHLECR